jgi:hypothetical protein
MGRALPRRVWHSAAALVPLPLIGLGVLAAFQANPGSVQVELYLSGTGSTHALSKAIGTSPRRLTGDTAHLFRASGKGPRADHYVSDKPVTSAGKQLITASLAGDPGITSATWPRSEISRDRKADRLRPTTTNVALKNSGDAGNPLLMNAAHGSMFGPSLDVDSFRPSAEEVAYSPSPAALDFRYKGETQAEFENRERRCLATALYFEARGEPVRGQIAVGQVILNRVRSPQFPETICGVVFQGQHQPGCQFSFACDGKTDIPRDDREWAQAQDLSKKIMAGELWLQEVGYSTYFHANYVSPYWKGDMSRIDKIGRHIFYKKRNEQPYIVEASADAGETAASESETSSGFLMTPTLSVVSTVSSLADSTAAPTPAMSLGFAASE